MLMTVMVFTPIGRIEAPVTKNASEGDRTFGYTPAWLHAAGLWRRGADCIDLGRTGACGTRSNGYFTTSLFQADEIRLALFDERLHRLVMILGVEGHHLIRQRRVHNQVGLLLEPFVDGELAPSDRQRRSIGEFLRKFARLRHHLLR